MDIHQNLLPYHFKQFFHKHNALSIYKRLDNETIIKLHRKLLDESTDENASQQPLVQPQPP